MSFKLTKTKKNIKSNYKIICNQIKNSIFSHLGYSFFEQLVRNDIIHVYNIKRYKSISSIITVINYENYKIINKQIIFFLIIRPIILIQNIFFLIKSLSKRPNITLNSNYLHLLHLVIFKKDFFNMSLKKKDILFNKFYKEILKIHKCNILFLCFEENNKKAYKYYQRNKFKFFYKKKDIIYVKKKYKK
tara:strand:+ start:1239 stop:1805 length:567 start_codon:yes stop_codon:yes gene_type:complete